MRRKTASDTPSTTGSGTPHDPRQCRRALALPEACLEELKVRSDADCRRLHRHLDARIAQVLAEVKQLGALVEGDVPDAPAQRLAAQLDELRAKSEAAYALLRGTCHPTGHDEPPNGA